MKKADIQAHYKDNIKGATDSQLFRILEERINASKQIRDTLSPMARGELIARGYDFPEFTAMFRVDSATQ